jgi:hypothetical protein
VISRLKNISRKSENHGISLAGNASPPPNGGKKQLNSLRPSFRFRSRVLKGLKSATLKECVSFFMKPILILKLCPHCGRN